MIALILFTCLPQDVYTASQTLTNPSGQPWGDYGVSVALDGDWLAVGSADNQSAQAGPGSGSVFTYERDASGAFVAWGEIPSPGGQPGASFGRPVDILDDMLIASAQGTGSLLGRVYYYERDSTRWNLSATLVSGSSADAYFARAVGFGSNFVAASHPHADNSRGAVFVYDFPLQGPTAPSHSLPAPVVLDQNDLFGWDVAVSDDDHIAVSCLGRGEAYIYERQPSSGAWTLLTAITHPGIGYSLDWGGERLLVSAPYTPTPTGSGVVHEFALDGSLRGELTGAGHHHFGLELKALPGHVYTHARQATPGLPSRVLHHELVPAAGWTLRGTFLPTGPGSGQGMDAQGSEVTLGGAQASPGSVGVFERPAPFLNTCITSVNSTGQHARIGAVGTASASGPLSIVADGLPAQYGWLFSGPTSTILPFGNGYICVGGGLTRRTLRPVTPAGTIGFAVSGAQAGTTEHYQVWFADPLAGGAGFNLTDGLEVTFAP